MLIGILEGLAEATAGLSKGYFGKLSDHTGRRIPFVQWGYGLSAVSKPLMAFLFTRYGSSLLARLTVLYGIYAAATEGISKVWISNITNKKDTATAIGTYSGFQSIGTLLASTVAGVIWFRFGAMTTFLLTGVMTLLVLLYMAFLPYKNMHSDN